MSLLLAALFWAGFVYLSAVYIPAHRAEGEGYFYVHRYAYLGRSLTQIVGSFFTRPGLWLGHLVEPRSLALLALYLVPLGLLPLGRPKILALLIPTILYTLLSESPEQRSIFHQYTAMWIPFLMIAAGEALAGRQGTVTDFAVGEAMGGRQGTVTDFAVRFRSPQNRLTVPDERRLTVPREVVLLTASILGFLAFSPLFGLSMHPELFQPESWAGEARGILSTIAPDQPVSAPSALCPHLSHRRVLLLKPQDKWQDVESILMLPDFPPSGD